MKKHIIFEKIQKSNNFIDINSTLKNFNHLNKNINSKEDSNFILSLLSKYYKADGKEIYVSKIKDEKLADIEFRYKRIF